MPTPLPDTPLCASTGLHRPSDILLPRFQTKSGWYCTLAIAASCVVLAACSKPAATEEPVRAVKILTVQFDRLESGGEFAGEVRARVESRLGFRVGGKISARSVEVGQRVKAGQVLARLDAQDYRLATDAARAQAMAAGTNRDLANADFRRFKELKEQNFISSAELERRESGLKAAQAQLEQTQAQVELQNNQVAHTQLVADVSGIVTAVEAERGQVVSAGTTIVRIAQDGPRDVVFSVTEDHVNAIRPGSPVTVRPWAAGEGLKGNVREVAAVADPVTRTFQIKATLDAPAGASPLPLGSTVYVLPQAFARADVAVIKLPTSALKQDGKTTAVWVLDSATMTVKSQAIEVLTADGNDAVVSSGLRPGMNVVSAGVHVLQEGQKVTIYQEKIATTPVQQAQAATKNIASEVPANVASAPSK